MHIWRNTEGIRIIEFLKGYHLANLKVITCILILKGGLYMIILKYIFLPPRNSTLVKHRVLALKCQNLAFLVKDSNIGSLHVFRFCKALPEVLFNDFFFKKDGCGEERERHK